MTRQRVLLIVLFSVSFLVIGLIAASLGAAFGFRNFSQTEQSIFMLILPCCGLPLVVTGSTATMIIGQTKATNTQTFIRMGVLGLAITTLLTFGIVALIASIFG